MTTRPREAISGLKISPWVGRVMAIVAAVCASVTGMERDSLLASVQRHFEWGEYDQIVQEARPALDSLAGSRDSLLISDLHKYLGVAYFAQGKAGEAREEFLLSYEHHTQTTLDKDFVSAAIYDLYRRTGEEVVNRRIAERAIRDSLARAESERARQALYVKTAVDSLRHRRRSALAGGVVSSVACAGLAAAAAWQYTLAERHYALFLDAVRQRNLQDYRAEKELVEEADLTTFVTGVASGVAAVGAAVFFVRLAGRTREIRRISSQGVRFGDLTITPGGRLVIDF